MFMYGETIIVKHCFSLKNLKNGISVDFSDQYYQIQLPMHARSTASQSIKNNLKITEFITQPNILTNKSKVSN